jgi:hypothetical protein
MLHLGPGASRQFLGSGYTDLHHDKVTDELFTATSTLETTTWTQSCKWSGIFRQTNSQLPIRARISYEPIQ